MIIRFLKRIFVICFSNTPYRIQRFNSIYHIITGGAIDEPETLSTVLKYQQGEVNYYAAAHNASGQKINERILKHELRFKKSGFFKAPDRLVYSVSNAGILGQIGLVYDPAKRSFIAESASDWTQNLNRIAYTNAFRLPDAKYLPGVTLSFLTLGADGGFYHFLLESMVKAGMFAGMMEQADHFLFNGPHNVWKQRWIDRADIDSSKIIWVSYSSHYLCEQLLFTSKLIGDQQANPWCVETLRTLMNIKQNEFAGKEKKAIWISRRDASSRSIAWEEELLALYPNIKPVILSEMDAEETIHAFCDATHVIAPHGAGLTNLYLCSAGTSVLEFFPKGDTFKPCYQRLAGVCGLDHQSLYLDFEDKTNADLGIVALSATLNKFLC